MRRNSVRRECSIIFGLITSRYKPRIRLRSPRFVVGWFPPHTKSAHRRCQLSYRHSASIHIKYERMIWAESKSIRIGLRNALCVRWLNFCCGKKLAVNHAGSPQLILTYFGYCTTIFSICQHLNIRIICFLLPNRAENCIFEFTVYIFPNRYDFFIFATYFCRILCDDYAFYSHSAFRANICRWLQIYLFFGVPTGKICLQTVHGHGIIARYEITHPCGFSGLCRSAVLRKDDVRGGNKNRRF